MSGNIRLIALASLAAAVAWAGPITDPAMGLDDGSLSSPITGATFSPINGGGVFDFFNDTGELIALLTFDTTVLPGLLPEQIAAFVCNDANTPGHPNPFFVNCSISYHFDTGLIDISFFGLDTNHLGIPPGDPNCHSSIQHNPCVGHFFVTLNDNFTLFPNGPGGWNDPALVGPNGITFGVAGISPTSSIPEPSISCLTAGALGFLAIIWRRRKKLSSS